MYSDQLRETIIEKLRIVDKDVVAPLPLTGELPSDSDLRRLVERYQLIRDVGIDSNNVYTFKLMIPIVIGDGKARTVYYDDNPSVVLLHELIGDISQDFDECSYNEDSVYGYWVNGALNKAYQEATASKHYEVLEGYKLFDDDYDGLMTFLVKESNGWPANYEPLNLKALRPQGKAKVAAFDSAAWLKKYRN